MKSEPQWLLANVAPEIIDLRPIKVKDKHLGEVPGHVKIENVDEKGQLQVSANYNSSPFANTHVPKKFYLTQAQLDEFLDTAAKCVLNVPAKG